MRTALMSLLVAVFSLFVVLGYQVTAVLDRMQDRLSVADERLMATDELLRVVHQTEEVKQGCFQSLAVIVNGYLAHRNRGGTLQDAKARLEQNRQRAEMNGSPWGERKNNAVFVEILELVYQDKPELPVVEAAVERFINKCIEIVAEHPANL